MGDDVRSEGRSAPPRRLLWDCLAAAQTLLWTGLTVACARAWLVNGAPAVSMAGMGLPLTAATVLYFGVSLPLVVVWLLSLRRSGLYGRAARWAWALGIALVPLVGIAYHVLRFRRARRAGRER